MHTGIITQRLVDGGVCAAVHFAVTIQLGVVGYVFILKKAIIPKE